MKLSITYLLVLFYLINSEILFSQAIIIDHNCAKLEPIPASAIELAKANLHIAYEHTSHGSQIITGMNDLIGQTGLVGYKGDIYNWNEGGTNGALDIDDYFTMENRADLGAEDQWAPATRTYLDDATNSEVNVIIWSWCNIYGHDIDKYLTNMETLISEYGPGGTKISDGTRTVPVTFVFMTGHTNAGSENEGTFNANKQIRQHCINNNRVLYDFYDIECYDPDGNYFGDGEPNTTDYGTYNGSKNLEDDCSYNLDGGGRGNWALEWQGSHTEGVDWYNCDPSHTLPLNGNLKAYAAWWLWAKLAGWDDGSNFALNITADEPMNECNLDSRSLNITITGDTFIDDQLANGNFQLNGAPSTTTIESITYIDSENASLALAFDGTDFDVDINNFSITISGAELTGDNDLTSNELIISANNEVLEIEAEVSLFETNLDDGVINLSLTDESFSDDQLDNGNFQLNNVPPGTSIESVVYTDATHAVLNLTFDGTDFDTNFEHFSVTISTNELTGCHDLTSNELIIESIDEDSPYLTISVDEQLTEHNLNEGVVHLSLTNVTFIDGTFDLTNFYLNNEPTGCTIEGITYLTNSTADLNLAFDGTDFDNDYTQVTVTIKSEELSIGNDLTSNTLIIDSELEPAAQASVSADMIESQLDGAIILLELDDETFIANCSSTDEFILKNVPNGVTIASIECRSDTEVSLTMTFDGTDFDSDSTNFYILIDKSVLSGNSDLTTNSLTVYAEIESNISDINRSNQVNVFPNPGNGIINVQYESIATDKINIHIIDMTGKTLMQKEYGFSNTQFKTSIDINSFDKGQYYLILRQGETKIVKSIILQ